MTTASEWRAAGATRAVDRRVAMKRTGLVYYNVACYRGVIVRKGENGRPEYDRCPHAHTKPGAAKKCAEKAARRANRGID